MNDEDVLNAIRGEVARARAKHPHWPDDPVHQAAIVAEESGELVRAALRTQYGEGGTLADIDREAIHTAATCVRLLAGR